MTYRRRNAFAISLCLSCFLGGINSPSHGAALLQEGFENAGDYALALSFSDVGHSSDSLKNVAISSTVSHSGRNSLAWLRHDSGGYRVAAKRPISSRTGRITVTYWANFKATNPYWWKFSLMSADGKTSFFDMFEGVGYPGNEYYVWWGWLRYVNPDGTWKVLAPLREGWQKFRIVADFNTRTASVFYGDMRLPVETGLPLSPLVKPDSAFVPQFSGISSVGEAPFYLDDILIEDVPAVASPPVAAAASNFVQKSGDTTFKVSKSTGAISGVSLAGIKLVTSTNDLYIFDGESNASYAQEKYDVVRSSTNDGQNLVLSATNPQLRGISIRKTYSFSLTGEILKKVEFKSSGAKGFLKLTSRVTLDKTFRARANAAGWPFKQGLQAGELTALAENACYIRADNAVGVGGYRWRVNGRYVLPRPAGSWENGWDAPVFSDYVKPGGPISAETKIWAFKGDFTDYERHLTASPEYRALFPATPAAWKDALVADAMYTSTEVVDYHKLAAPLPVSSTIWFLNPPWGNWWSYSDPPKNLDPDVKTLAPRFRGVLPNARVSAYTNLCFDSNSDIYKNHRDFGVTDRDGQIFVTGTPSDAKGAPTYYFQILKPEVRKYLLDMHFDRVKNWGLDFYYMDGPGSFHEMPDYKLKRVVQGSDWLDYFRDLKTRMQLVSPNTLFFTNSIMPYSDIGYIEWRDARWQQTVGSPLWRYCARELLNYKLRETPGYLIIPTYGNYGAQPGISTYAINYGWGGHGANAFALPYQVAALEYRGLNLVKDAVNDPWWRSGSEVEAYGFTKGENAIVNVIAHNTDTEAIVSVNPAKLGLKVGQQYLLRVLAMNPVQEKGGPDQAFTIQSLRRLTLAPGPMTLEVPVKQGLLTSVVISSALAIAEDNGAKKSQTGLVENYATHLRSVTTLGAAKRYDLVTKYAATLFFPYATALSATSPQVTQEEAEVNGVSGIRIRVATPLATSLDVVYSLQ